MATVANFPDEIMTAGPYVARLFTYPVEFPVLHYEFEDGGHDVNVQPCGLRRFELLYEGITAAEVQTLVDHYNLAKGRTNDFSFYHRHLEDTFAGCTYEAFEIQKHPKKWACFVRAVLVRFE